jgi:hypothetical protein
LGETFYLVDQQQDIRGVFRFSLCQRDLRGKKKLFALFLLKSCCAGLTKAKEKDRSGKKKKSKRERGFSHSQGSTNHGENKRQLELGSILSSE